MPRACGLPKSPPIADIDSERMLMRIERCKGGKERAVMLSQPLLAILRRYWRLAAPALFSFPGQTHDKPIEPIVRSELERSHRGWKSGTQCADTICTYFCIAYARATATPSQLEVQARP